MKTNFNSKEHLKDLEECIEDYKRRIDRENGKYSTLCLLGANEKAKKKVKKITARKEELIERLDKVEDQHFLLKKIAALEEAVEKLACSSCNCNSNG